MFMLNRFGQTPLECVIDSKIGKDQSFKEEHQSTVSELNDVREQIAHKKADKLIQRMQKFNQESGIRFVKKPVRIDLKFEKSFVTALRAGKNDVLELFPEGSI